MSGLHDADNGLALSSVIRSKESGVDLQTEFYPDEDAKDLAAPSLERDKNSINESNDHLIAIDPAKMPVRMLPISSEDLAHAEDKKLDSEYEAHMHRLGDSLLPIKGGTELLEDFAAPKEELETEVWPLSGTRPKSPNRAVEIARGLGSDNVEEDGELPTLPENPSEQELIDYAEKHPGVKAVLKLFRGRIVRVRKR